MISWIVCGYLTLGLAWTLAVLERNPHMSGIRARLADQGARGFLRFLIPVFLWVPIALACWSMVAVMYVREKRLTKRLRRIRDAIQGLNRTMVEIEAIDEETKALRGRVESGETEGIEERMGALERRMTAARQRVGDTMAFLMNGRCLKCEGELRRVVTETGPRTVCGRCGQSYTNLRDVEAAAASEELRKED
jgi:hypothetical protein